MKARAVTVKARRRQCMRGECGMLAGRYTWGGSQGEWSCGEEEEVTGRWQWWWW